MSPAVLLEAPLTDGNCAPHADITPPDSPSLAHLWTAAQGVAGSADAALSLIGTLRGVPLPASGATRRRWEVLASLAAADLTAARVAEAHLDALAILAEVDPAVDVPDATTASTWGVFAAEGGDRPLRATDHGGSWTLNGVKPWCSLADRLTHALVTAHVDGGRRLFAIALRQPGVTVLDQAWVSRGLADVPSGPIALDDVAAVPVGDTDWYLDRPGFAWGGAGVAACWYGGAVAVARLLATTIANRPEDVLGRMHLGAVDLALTAARAVLSAAADEIDARITDPRQSALLAARVRGVVARTAEEVLQRSAHALGPAPLAQDEEHARRVADLSIYLRQHHAERDDASLGAMIPAGGCW